MINIVGNIKQEDDYTHPLGPETNFNESVYFNFFDPVQGRGGFIRMGNRANEGYAELTVIIYNPDGSALFNYKKPSITHNDSWDAGGGSIEVLVPGEKIRTAYTGAALYMANPRDMQDPGKAFKSNPFKKISVDLTHTGVGPIYGHVGSMDDGNDFARAHYEQHMHVSGTIEIEGESGVIQINGNGLRDHSWGPRYWQSIRSYRWLTGNYGDDLGMVLSVVGDPGTSFHRGFTVDVTLENGDQHQVQGKVKGFVPLRNRRSEQITYIGEGMTEYTLDGGRVGYGLSEYLDQPGDIV